MVFPHNVSAIWPEASEVLLPAIELGGTHSPDDVRKALLAGNAQLWVHWEEKVKSALVTEFVNYPKGAWLRLWLMGGNDVEWDEYEWEIIRFANANQCVGMELWGRKGWTKYYPEADEMTMLRRRL